MFIGPVFTREVVTAPRRARLYIARTACAGGLFILICTAWLLVTGTQIIRSSGEMARFGTLLFQFLAPLQMVLALAFSALLATSAVSQEKDRRTLVLLLMTRLANHELVLGTLMASMLVVLVMLAAAWPIYMMLALFGGVAFDQIVRVFLVTLAGAFAAGSLGSTLAYWREKTFQTLALTVLTGVFWIGSCEVLRRAGSDWPIDGATWATLASPLRAVEAAAAPFYEVHPRLAWLGHPAHGFLLVALAAAALLNAIAVWRIRIWQIEESRRLEPAEARPESLWTEESAGMQAAILSAMMRTEGGHVSAALTQQQQRRLKDLAAIHQQEWSEESAANTPETAPEKMAAGSTKRPTRHVWDNPILWREICTWAYGRRILFIRLVYGVMVALCAWGLASMSSDGINSVEAVSVLVPLAVLSLILVNAQAVSSFIGERDAKALDLLLVTDLTPNEVVFGKLGGVFYNTKEMVLAPLVVCITLGFLRDRYGIPLASTKEVVMMVVGMLVLYAFVAMLGLHAGMTYVSTKSAVAVSLGTVFFLFLGVATSMWMMVAFAGSFTYQLVPFAGFLVGGGAGLYLALGVRNPSDAIGWASFVAPFATFYAITSMLQQYYHPDSQQFSLPVFFVVSFTYGFATAAMLIPALDKFDVALGRTTGDESD